MSSDGLLSLSDACFENAVELIHSLTGISISPGRRTMVLGRMRRRASELGFTDYDSYLDLVRKDPGEKRLFVDLVTTNETYFFRTPRIWKFIEDEFLPSWLRKNEGKTLQAWSAAASSGDEAHSLAVLLEDFREKHPHFTYQILGTDISREMIELCRKGVYQGRSIESFRSHRPDLFAKYMESSSEGYSIRADIKLRMKFLEHNLFQPLPMSTSFDLVLIRNVLIYFKGNDQEKVLKLIEPRLAPDGKLIIGESESLSYIRTGFTALQPLVYRKSA